MILDCHCHIASRRIMPPEFFNGWSKTVKSNLSFSLDEVQERRVDELLHELTEDPDCVSMLQEMDQAGIDKAIFLVIGFGLAYNNVALTIENIPLEHRKLLDRSNRFIAFSNVRPRLGLEGIERFE